MRKTLYSGIAVGLSVLMMGCNFTIPKSVKVIADTTYELKPIVDASIDIFDGVSLDNLVSVESNEIAVYDYNPGGNAEVRSYALRMDLINESLDMSEMLDGFDLSSSVQDMSIEQKINIPAIPSPDVNESITLDALEDLVNTMVSSLEGPTNADADSYIQSAFSTMGQSFDTVKYISGTLRVTVPGSVGNLITLKTNGDTYKARANANDTAEFDLADKIISATGFRVDAITGYFECEVVDGVVDTVTGLTLSTPQEIGSVNKSITKIEEGTFNKCIVEEGSLEIGVAVKPSWTNIGLVKTIELTDGMTVGAAEFDATGKANLANKEILAGRDIMLDMEITVQPTNGTIVFTDVPALSAKMDVKKVTVEKKVDSEIGVNKDEPLDGDTTKLISEITFKAGTGVKVTYENTLPAGNDIDMTISSGFIGLNKSDVLAAGTTKETVCELYSSTNYTKAIDENTTMDFNVDILLPGVAPGAQGDAAKTMTVTNVVPGTEYKLIVKPEVVIDWETAKVKLSELRAKPFEGTVDTAMNPADFLSFLDSFLGKGAGEKLALESLPIHIYATKPKMAAGKTNPFDNISFKGYIKLALENAIDSSFQKPEVDLLKSTGGVLSFVDTLPEAKNGAITETLGGTVGELASVLSDYKKLPTATEDPKLVADYKIGINDNVTDFLVQKDDLGSDSKISITAYIVLPLKLTVKDTISTSLNDMVGIGNEDLLGRSGPDTKESFVDLISMSLDYSFSESPIKGDVGIEFGWNIPDVSPMNFSFTKGSAEIKEGDMAKLRAQYPLTPEVKLVVKKGSIYVPREMKMKMTAGMKLGIKGEYEFDL